MWRLGVGEERARVAIVGCGGAGCNVLRRVATHPNATRIAVNDAVHPSMAEVSTRVLVAPGSLQAYASMDEKAVPNMETDEEKEISAALLDRDTSPGSSATPAWLLPRCHSRSRDQSDGNWRKLSSGSSRNAPTAS